MRATSLVAAALAAVTTSGCDRPDPRVVCHNSNCVEPTRPEDDDTLPAMRASLAFSSNGLPAFDGIEIDTFWRASDSTCLFAHDLDAPRTTLAAEAGDELAAYIAATERLTRTGKPFRVFIELKPHVTVDKTVRHSPEQRALHADCVWDIYQRIAAAAVDNAREVEVVVASFNPDLLRTMIDRAPASLPVPVLYDGFYGIPAPLDPQTHPQSDYTGLPLGIYEIHPQWIHDAQWEGLLTDKDEKGIEILFWTFSTTVETLDAIEQYEPDWVGTSEIRFMRRWLDR